MTKPKREKAVTTVASPPPHGRSAALEEAAVAAESEGLTVTRATRADTEVVTRAELPPHPPVPTVDPEALKSVRLALEAGALACDLGIIQRALASGDTDTIRRVVAGPIGVVARSTVARLQSPPKQDDLSTEGGDA
jgi:hypothetical protein